MSEDILAEYEMYHHHFRVKPDDNLGYGTCSLGSSYFARADSEPYVESDLSSDPDDIDPDQEAVASHLTVLYDPGFCSSSRSFIGNIAKTDS